MLCYEVSGPQSTHKFNSIEDSIWDQTFPGAISTGIIMDKRHTVRFSQNNHDFKGPHPESNCGKIIFRQTSRSRLCERFDAEEFLLDAFRVP